MDFQIYLACAFAIFWTYLGYPIFLLALSKYKHQYIRTGPLEPKVSIIIAAYNEQLHIKDKIESCLAIDYPKEKLEIIVASDCSSDDTNEIVRSYESRGVILADIKYRGGKTAAQNHAATKSSGEILVFTDASTEIPKNVLQSMVSNFYDERVGCVGADLQYVSDQQSSVGKGNLAYWNYERKIRELETSINSLVGVSGALYAVRSSLYTGLEADMSSDFVIASDIFLKNKITVNSSLVTSVEKTNEKTQDEFKMRVRVAVGSINALIRYSRLLNPFQHGLYSIQLLSHKVLRYTAPLFLITLFLVNFSIALDSDSKLLLFSFYGQCLFYASALLGWLAQELKIKIPGLHIPFYFCSINAAALWAWYLYFKGERMVVWTPNRQELD